MSEQILNVLETLRKQWGELYAISQETTQMIEQMQTHIAEMEAHATRIVNLAIVCSSVAFVLAIGVASLMIWRRIYKDDSDL